MAQTGQTAPRPAKIEFPLTLSVRLDYDSDRELDYIAIFEKTKKAALIRSLVTDTVQRYRRNPQYLKFRRSVENLKEKQD